MTSSKRRRSGPTRPCACAAAVAPTRTRRPEDTDSALLLCAMTDNTPAARLAFEMHGKAEGSPGSLLPLSTQGELPRRDHRSAPHRAHLEVRGARPVGVVDAVSPHVCGCTLRAARAGLRHRSRLGRARRGPPAVALAGAAVVLAGLCLTRVPTPRRRQAWWRLSSGPARAMEAPGPPSRTRPGRGPRVPDST
jgi:hypothetical protein